MTKNGKNKLVTHLPDMAILMMIIVIVVSLAILQHGDIAVWILLPLGVYMALLWFKKW